MASSTDRPRTRKSPHERRAEILDAAATIATDEGLERITLRAVADRLGVRPGLVTHYFPVAEELVVEAFVQAASAHRENMFPAGGSPLQQLHHFVTVTDRDDSLPPARLWLNARHLSRFVPGLAVALSEQQRLDEARLGQIIEAAITEGSIRPLDVADTAVRILMALDGKGAYANDITPYTEAGFEYFVSDYTEWALGLTPGRLRVAPD